MKYEHKLKIFIRFLKKNKIYHKFLTNGFSSNGFKTRSEYWECSTPSLFDFISDQLKRKDWGTVVDGCFTWDYTKEGVDYWYDMYCRWDEIVKKYNDETNG